MDGFLFMRLTPRTHEYAWPISPFGNWTGGVIVFTEQEPLAEGGLV